MKSCSLFFLFSFLSASVFAQWAVYDDEVNRQLVRINKVDALYGLGSDKTFDHFESERDGDTGDVKMSNGDSRAKPAWVCTTPDCRPR